MFTSDCVEKETVTDCEDAGGGESLEYSGYKK